MLLQFSQHLINSLSHLYLIGHGHHSCNSCSSRHHNSWDNSCWNSKIPFCSKQIKYGESIGIGFYWDRHKGGNFYHYCCIIVTIPALSQVTIYLRIITVQGTTTHIITYKKEKGWFYTYWSNGGRIICHKAIKSNPGQSGIIMSNSRNIIYPETLTPWVWQKGLMMYIPPFHWIIPIDTRARSFFFQSHSSANQILSYQYVGKIQNLARMIFLYEKDSGMG